MYPNPQDVLPLPPRPDPEQYRKRAKELVKVCKSGDDATHSWAMRWVDRLFELQTDVPRQPSSRDVERLAQQITDFARERMDRQSPSLSQAQFVIARAHGFASWAKLVRHIEGLAGADSEVSAFELAADAIVSGDLALLERLLARDPDLARARSTREHQATLLHYVSANGVENFRQKTPADIVAIARRLLDAGADVNAEADVYGGGATTLGLVVTSAHPRQAGVQAELADLLLDRGARIDARIVRDCLANGCPEAAAHMVERGASVNLEEAAGLGQADVVAQYFAPPSSVSDADAAAAVMMASWYGQQEVIALLLDRGVDVATRSPKDGNTALHIAAYCGDPALVELLLERGAPVNATDAVYETPPLVWALHAWLVDGREQADAYRAVLHQLVDAGAEVMPEWLDDDRLRAEADLHAALSRRAAMDRATEGNMTYDAKISAGRPPTASVTAMDRVLRFTGSVRREPAIDAWMNQHSGELGAIARHWFDVIRGCGDDVREVLHDGHPTACIDDAGFAYVNAFTAHVNVGFFRGAELPDPAGLLEGTGKYMRHVKLRPGHDMDAKALVELIESAYADMKRRLE